MTLTIAYQLFTCLAYLLAISLAKARAYGNSCPKHKTRGWQKLRPQPINDKLDSITLTAGTRRVANSQDESWERRLRSSSLDGSCTI